MRTKLVIGILFIKLLVATVCTTFSIVWSSEYEPFDGTSNNLAFFAVVGGFVPCCFLGVAFFSRSSASNLTFLRWVVVVGLVLQWVTHAWWTIRVGQTFLPDRVLWQCFLCTASVQVIACSGDISEVWWKKTDYLWVTVGLVGLVCGSLPRVRAEMLKDGGTAHTQAVDQARARVALLAKESYMSKEMEKHFEQAAAYRGRPQYKERDKRFRLLLAGAVDRLSQISPEWTAEDLVATIPPADFDTSDLFRADHLQRAIQNMKDVQESRDWYIRASELTMYERFGVSFGPLAICVAIALRLGKTTAEVRKLYLGKSALLSPSPPA